MIRGGAGPVWQRGSTGVFRQRAEQFGGVAGQRAGRVGHQPAEIAPELTTTTVCPWARKATISLANRSIVSAVTEDEPSLSTSVCGDVSDVTTRPR